MSQDVTARHGLPNLFVGQAQKEITHNEALARIDALLHPAVQDDLTAPPVSLGTTNDGMCWLIAAPGADEWAGKAGKLARWSGGSWRYLDPVIGMIIWHIADGVRFFYNGTNWVSPVGIANPTGGAVVDAEARLAITSILTHLRSISNIPA